MVSSLHVLRKTALTGLVLFVVTAMPVCPVPVCQALTVKSDIEGNIFTDTQKMTFQVSDFTRTVEYELRDYFGTIVAFGKARKQKNISLITIPSPGPGHYMLTCHDDADTVRVAAGVVIDRGNAPLPSEGRVCGQSSAQWLLKDEAGYNRLARIIKRSGIPWVREAIYWGAVESTKGQYNWGETSKAVRAMNANGISVTIWLAGDSPTWARASGIKSQCPEDYRELYRFSKILAEEYKDADIAWEIGIEPDMNGIYWFDLGDLVAGFHKAAYLGIKDGDPDVPILPASITLGPTTFLENMLDSGIGDYSDMFNWHIYDKPSRYPERAKHYRQLLSRYGMADAPDWLTEFGAVYKNTEGPDQTNLSGENQRAQCRFVAQSIIMALVSGVDKAFYFLIPGIHDPNGEEFGLMYADLSPYPGYIALSAAANMLGLSTYSGRYENPSDKNVEAYVFTVSGMTTLVACSNEPGELRVPTEKKSIQVADVFGKKRKVDAQDGTVRVPVGPDAVYLLDVGDTVKSHLTGPVPEPSRPHPCHPSRIFTLGYCKLPMGFESDCYRYISNFPYTVNVYNLDTEKTVSGTIEIVIQKEWKGENLIQKVTVPPMGRERITATLKPSSKEQGIKKVFVKSQFDGEAVSPSASYFINFFSGTDQETSE